LSVISKVFLHGKEGYEVLVEEYDPNLNKTNTFSFILTDEHDEISFIGRIFYENGFKKIETYHDQIFLDQWGIGRLNKGQKMIYHNAENYELTYNLKKYHVTKISYFDPDGTDEMEKTYFEVYLDKDLQSLCWQRFKQNVKSTTVVAINGKSYGLEYQCVTDRLISLTNI
jgi:hypothetical protein